MLAHTHNTHPHSTYYLTHKEQTVARSCTHTHARTHRHTHCKRGCAADQAGLKTVMQAKPQHNKQLPLLLQPPLAPLSSSLSLSLSVSLSVSISCKHTHTHTHTLDDMICVSFTAGVCWCVLVCRV